jgi:hypothetical protein
MEGRESEEEGAGRVGFGGVGKFSLPESSPHLAFDGNIGYCCVLILEFWMVRGVIGLTWRFV